MMEIIYTGHAVERMQQRKISTQEVEKIIHFPDRKIQQSQQKIIFFKKLSGRQDNSLAAVVVVYEGDKLEVITVMNHFKEKA